MPLDGKMHTGHRQRLKERFINEGLSNFEQHNILELLLFYMIPQKDTNELAHQLLNRFGTISDVFSAPVSELVTIKGIGMHTAQLIAALPGVFEIYQKDRAQYEPITGREELLRFASKRFVCDSPEQLLMICVDNTQMLLNWHFLQEREITLDNLDMRHIIDILIGSNATAAVFAHFYPEKKPRLTSSEKAIVSFLARGLRTVGITVLDYAVFGSDDSYLSFYEQKNNRQLQLLLSGHL